MVERINRQMDERIYQPKIHSSLIHEISRIREITDQTMTVIVDQAIREYLGKYEAGSAHDANVSDQVKLMIQPSMLGSKIKVGPAGVGPAIKRLGVDW
jgi:hypothetical protein